MDVIGSWVSTGRSFTPNSDAMTVNPDPAQRQAHETVEGLLTAIVTRTIPPTEVCSPNQVTVDNSFQFGFSFNCDQ